MGDDKPIGERIAVLETEMRHIRASLTTRSIREWGILMVIVGLLATVLAKNMGWIN